MNQIKFLKAIRFDKEYTPFTKMAMVALYNESRIEEAEVKKRILSDDELSDPFVVIMSETQYKNLFDVQPEPNYLEELRLEQQGGIV